MIDDDRDQIMTAANLDMTDEDVRRRWPDAVEYVALDGAACWQRAELLDDDMEDRR